MTFKQTVGQVSAAHLTNLGDINHLFRQVRCAYLTYASFNRENHQ